MYSPLSSLPTQHPSGDPFGQGVDADDDNKQNDTDGAGRRQVVLFLHERIGLDGQGGAAGRIAEQRFRDLGHRSRRQKQGRRLSHHTADAKEHRRQNAGDGVWQYHMADGLQLGGT